MGRTTRRGSGALGASPVRGSRAITAGIVGAGALGAVALWRSRRPVAPAVPSAIGTTGRAGRNVVLAKAATKAGGSWASDRARRVFADAERREHVEHLLDLARDVVQAEEVIDYTLKENVAEKLAKRFGASIGAGMWRAATSASANRLR